MPRPLIFAVDGAGAPLRLQFLDGDYPKTIEQELESDGFHIAVNNERTVDALDELLAYCCGTRRNFGLPVVFAGSVWQNTVWQALTHIPYGQTRTYGQVATMVGRAGAARAVGRANATNPIPLVVPCHRVVGSDGSLTGYGGGIHLKIRLFQHEGIGLRAHSSMREGIGTRT